MANGKNDLSLTPGIEPGESEFSHGRGLQASSAQRLALGTAAGGVGVPLSGEVYSPYERLRAERGLDPTDPNAEVDQDAWTRGP